MRSQHAAPRPREFDTSELELQLIETPTDFCLEFSMSTTDGAVFVFFQVLIFCWDSMIWN